MLSRLEVQTFETLPLGKGRQLSLFFLLLLVLALLIDGGVPGEFQTAAAGPEGVDVRLDLHGHRVIDGVGHLARHEPVPDQPVQPVLVPGKVLLYLLGGQLHIAGPDGLVGILGSGLGLVDPWGLRTVSAAVAPLNKAPDRGQRLVAEPQGVGTHIGDKAHRALA